MKDIALFSIYSFHWIGLLGKIRTNMAGVGKLL